jgi:hypothetical protein
VFGSAATRTIVIDRGACKEVRSETGGNAFIHQYEDGSASVGS